MVSLKHEQVSELFVVFSNIAKPCSFTARRRFAISQSTARAGVVGLHQHIMDSCARVLSE